MFYGDICIDFSAAMNDLGYLNHYIAMMCHVGFLPSWGPYKLVSEPGLRDLNILDV